MTNKINISYLRSFASSFLANPDDSEKPLDKTLIIGTLASGILFGMPGGLAFALGYKFAEKRLIAAPSSNPPAKIAQEPAPVFAAATSAGSSSSAPAAPATTPVSTSAIKTAAKPEIPRSETSVPAELIPSKLATNNEPTAPVVDSKAVKPDTSDVKPVVDNEPKTPAADTKISAQLIVSNSVLNSEPQTPAITNSQEVLPSSTEETTLSRAEIDKLLDLAAAQFQKSQTESASGVPKKDSPAAASQSWFSRFFSVSSPKMPGRPPGIPNAGNSCFAASTIGLIANSPLADSLPDLLRPPDENDSIYKSNRKRYEADVKNFNENKKRLAQLLATYKHEKAIGEATSSIQINQLRAFMPYSEGNQGIFNQQDAHELFLGISNSISVPLDDDRAKAKQKAKEHLHKNPLLHMKMFLKKYRVPQNASLDGTNLKRDLNDPTLAISQKFSLEIPFINLNLTRDSKTRRIPPLTTLLQREFFHNETTNAESYRLAHNQSAKLLCEENYFDRIPEALFINLVRQEHALIAGRFMSSAVTDPVSAPAVLPWNWKTASGEENAEFELQGYIRHTGGTSGGHYVAYIKDKDTGLYWHLDDGRVSSISAKEFENAKDYSYVLLYARKK